MMPNTPYSARKFWLLFLLASFTFLTAFQHYYQGEEAIFPITSLEMWQRGEWFKQYRFGIDLKHNPLFNWLIIPFSNLFGWLYVDKVARGLTICFTLSSAGVLTWLTLKLFKDHVFAAFTTLVYITFIEVLMYHGWLAYVDPLFGLLVFAAIATLWVACIEQRPALILFSVFLISCAFLSKAQTAYVFYTVALFVLGRSKFNRSILFSPSSLVMFSAMIAVPLLWYGLLVPHGTTQGKSMFDEILAKFYFRDGLSGYLSRLFNYPLEVWIGFFPSSLLVTYLALRKKINQPENVSEHFTSLVLIVGINFLPYWLAPQGPIRYLIPLYPLFALIIARLIWRSGGNAIATARRFAVASIVFNLLLGSFLFPYYQQHYRGKNYAETASDIISIAQQQPLYATDVTALGMSVVAYIDQMRYPQAAVHWPPENFESGFIISMKPQSNFGQVDKEYLLGGDKLYLLCRGSACEHGFPIK